jgi:hypothetical protein
MVLVALIVRIRAWDGNARFSDMRKLVYELREHGNRASVLEYFWCDVARNNAIITGNNLVVLQGKSPHRRAKEGE